MPAAQYAGQQLVVLVAGALLPGSAQPLDLRRQLLDGLSAGFGLRNRLDRPPGLPPQARVGLDFRRAGERVQSLLGPQRAPRTGKALFGPELQIQRNDRLQRTMLYCTVYCIIMTCVSPRNRPPSGCQAVGTLSAATHASRIGNTWT